VRAILRGAVQLRQIGHRAATCRAEDGSERVVLRPCPAQLERHAPIIGCEARAINSELTDTTTSLPSDLRTWAWYFVLYGPPSSVRRTLPPGTFSSGAARGERRDRGDCRERPS